MIVLIQEICNDLLWWRLKFPDMYFILRDEVDPSRRNSIADIRHDTLSHAPTVPYIGGVYVF